MLIKILCCVLINIIFYYSLKAIIFFNDETKIAKDLKRHQIKCESKKGVIEYLYLENILSEDDYVVFMTNLLAEDMHGTRLILQKKFNTN